MASIQKTQVSHRLGSSYDMDMSIAEDIVHAYKNPTNIESQKILFDYYINRIESTFQKLKLYIMSPDVEADIINNPEVFKSRDIREKYIKTIFEALSIIRREFGVYESWVKKSISDLQNNFNGILPIESILHIFESIADLYCLTMPRFLLIKEKEPRENDHFTNVDHYENIIDEQYYKDVYPLPNEIGLFGLNTYLYCFFEGVYLVGIPTHHQFYDLNYACPGNFIEHDESHTGEIKASNLKRQEDGLISLYDYKYYYDSILNDPNLSVIIKELLVLHLWCMIHEFIPENPDFDIWSDFPTFISNIMYLNIRDPLIIDFYPEYLKFQDIVITSPYISSLQDEFSKIENIKGLEVWNTYDSISSKFHYIIPVDIFYKKNLTPSLQAALRGEKVDPFIDIIILYIKSHWVARNIILERYGILEF